MVGLGLEFCLQRWHLPLTQWMEQAPNMVNPTMVSNLGYSPFISQVKKTEAQGGADPDLRQPLGGCTEMGWAALPES